MGHIDSRAIPWDEPPGHVGGFSKYLVGTHNGSTTMDFRISRYPIRGRVDLHTHEHEEQIYYIISGTGTGQLGQERFLLQPGDTLFVPPTVEHAVENTGDEDLVFVVVTSPPNVPRN